MIAIAIAIIVVCLLIYYNMYQEHFDTYYNHTVGANQIYTESDSLDQIEAAKSLNSTERLANYTWSARAPDGMQLYDYYYENALRDNGTNVKSDPTYYKRDLEADYLDTKFSVVNTSPEDDLGSSSYTHYSLDSMRERDPLYTVFNGENITLSQKSR